MIKIYYTADYSGDNSFLIISPRVVIGERVYVFDLFTIKSIHKRGQVMRKFRKQHELRITIVVGATRSSTSGLRSFEVGNVWLIEKLEKRNYNELNKRLIEKLKGRH